MAISPSNMLTMLEAVGVREDLTDVIYDISPLDTPFISAIGRGKAKQSYHEWQTSAIKAAVATNAVIEGLDAATDTSTITVRVGNYCQILDKVARVSGTTEVVNSAGRKSEMAFQMANRAKEIKRDLECSASQNKASVAGGTVTTPAARVLGSSESWITSSSSRGNTGTQGGFASGIVAAPTDGTTRAITEAMLKTVIASVWDAGGEGQMILCGPVNKQNISAFTGGSTRTDKGEDKRLTAAIDVYVSDFGTHRITPSRFCRDRSVQILTPAYWSLAYLRGFRTSPLAKTGDSERKQLLVEVTLEAKNQAANGILADLTT